MCEGGVWKSCQDTVSCHDGWTHTRLRVPFPLFTSTYLNVFIQDVKDVLAMHYTSPSSSSSSFASSSSSSWSSSEFSLLASASLRVEILSMGPDSDNNNTLISFGVHDQDDVLSDGLPSSELGALYRSLLLNRSSALYAEERGVTQFSDEAYDFFEANPSEEVVAQDSNPVVGYAIGGALAFVAVVLTAYCIKKNRDSSKQSSGTSAPAETEDKLSGAKIELQASPIYAPSPPPASVSARPPPPAPVRNQAWTKHYDANHQAYYFHNNTTGQSSWERPEDYVE